MLQKGLEAPDDTGTPIVLSTVTTQTIQRTFKLNKRDRHDGKGNRGTERGSGLPKDTQQGSGRARNKTGLLAPIPGPYSVDHAASFSNRDHLIRRIDSTE